VGKTKGRGNAASEPSIYGEKPQTEERQGSRSYRFKHQGGATSKGIGRDQKLAVRESADGEKKSCRVTLPHKLEIGCVIVGHTEYTSRRGRKRS